MVSNKKIINATPTNVGNIKFKSTLEASIYKALIDRGFEPLYELDSFCLIEGFKPREYYVRGKGNSRKFTDITYTPDFKIQYKELTIYIEVKGFQNDVYPYKKKLFLRKINNNPNIIFIETYSKKDLLVSIDSIIQSYERDSNRQNEETDKVSSN